MVPGSASLGQRSLPSFFTHRKSPPPTLSRRHMRMYCFSRHGLSLSPRDETLRRIETSCVIACLRANSAELAMEAAQAALRGGISILEIVSSTPGVFEVLRQLVDDYPETVFGVGTVLNIEDAKKAINAGAKFLMSPATVKNIMYDLQNGDALYIPGVMTPTEILSAYDAGVKMVKVYPVSALGGKQYISALRKPFPHISMVASQGITIESIGKYIDSGASSVVLSDAIFDKEAIHRKDFDKIYQLAKRASVQGNVAAKQLGTNSACKTYDKSSNNVPVASLYKTRPS